MKNLIRISYILVAAALFAAGFYIGKGQKGDDGEIPQGVILNSGVGLREIQEATDEFINAWNMGDAEGCANTYAESALLMPPGLATVRGRKAIMETYKGEVPANAGEMVLSEKVQEVIYFGEWAAMHGLGEISPQTTDSIGEKFSYKWVILSKRNPQGHWEAVWDIYNEMPE